MTLEDLKDKWKEKLIIETLHPNNVSVVIVHADKEVHSQILFDFYNELYLLGYNTRINVKRNDK